MNEYQKMILRTAKNIQSGHTTLAGGIVFVWLRNKHVKRDQVSKDITNARFQIVKTWKKETK